MARPKFKPTKEDEKIAKNFRTLRGELTYRDLAMVLTGKANYAVRICDIENVNAQPSIRDLKVYHEHFKVPYEFLLGETDNPEYENMLVAKDLGFSPDAIKTIKLIKAISGMRNKNGHEPTVMDVLNLLLGSGQKYFVDFLANIAQYMAQKPFSTAEATDEIMLESAEVKGYFHKAMAVLEHNKLKLGASISDNEYDAVLNWAINEKQRNYENNLDFLLFKATKEITDLVKKIQQEKLNGGVENG